MEAISKIVQAIQSTTQQQNHCLQVVTHTGTYPMRYNENGQAYLSAYNDLPANEQQIWALMFSFGEIYNYTKTALETFVTTILSEHTTLLQLKDALNHIYKTHDSKKYGKPKPADIINFDKPNTNEPLFLATEMAKMCEGMINLYYKPNDYHIDYSKLRDNAKKLFFKQLCDANGIPLREKKPTHPSGNCQCYFILTDKGWQHKDELIWCLNQTDVKRIACKNARKQD